MVGSAPQPGRGESSQPPGRSTCRPQRTACSSSGCHGNALLMTAAYFAMATGGKGLSSQQAALLGPGLPCRCPPHVGQSSTPPCSASPDPGAPGHRHPTGGAPCKPPAWEKRSPRSRDGYAHAPETAAPTLPCSVWSALPDGARSPGRTWCPGAGAAGSTPASLLGLAPFLLPLRSPAADVPSWWTAPPAPPHLPYQHPLPGKCHRQDRAGRHGARHVTLRGVGADTLPCSHGPPAPRHPGGSLGGSGEPAIACAWPWERRANTAV